VPLLCNHFHCVLLKFLRKSPSSRLCFFHIEHLVKNFTILTQCPQLRYHSSGIWLVFWYPDRYLSAQKGSKVIDQEVDQEIDQEIGSVAKKILRLIRIKPTITRKELAIQIGIAERAVQYQLSKLKSAGFLIRQGSTKAGSLKLLKAFSGANH